MAESVSLGTLEYEVDANFEKFEQKLREYEQSANAILRVLIEPDQTSLSELSGKIQAAMQPIRVTLDTSGAEAQMAALGMGGGGGSAVGGGTARMDLGGPWGPLMGPAPTPNSLAMTPLDPPSMSAIEAAAAYESQAGASPPPLPTSSGGAGGGGGGGGFGGGSFGPMRMLMLTHFAAQGAMGLERYEDLNFDMERTHDPLEGLSRARENINAQRGGMGGLVGLGGQVLAKAGPMLGAAGMIASAAGFDFNQFDASQGVHDLEKQEDDLRRQRAKQDQQLRYMGMSDRLGLGTHAGGTLGRMEDQAAVAGQDDDRKPIEHLNRAFQAAMDHIDATADELEKLGNNSPEARKRAAEFKTRAQAAEKTIHDAAVFEAWNEEEQQENAAALQSTRSDANLAFRNATVGARRKAAGGDLLGGALAANAARYQQSYDSLDWASDPTGSLVQVQALDAERAQDDADAARDDTLRGLRGPVAAAVRRSAVESSTAAYRRGAGALAGAFGSVTGIEGTANLGIDEGTVSGDYGEAFSAAQGGIAQLQNLEARLSAGNRSQSVDTAYANLSGAGGGEQARLLQDIRSAIDRLTSRMKAIGATD